MVQETLSSLGHFFAVPGCMALHPSLTRNHLSMWWWAKTGGCGQKQYIMQVI